MSFNALVRACKIYAHHMDKMQEIPEPDPEAMEEKEILRRVLHQAVLDEMKRNGISVKDRHEAERIARELAND